MSIFNINSNAGYNFNIKTLIPSENSISTIIPVSSGPNFVQIDLAFYLDRNINNLNIDLSGIVPNSNLYRFQTNSTQNTASKYIAKEFTLFFDSLDSTTSDQTKICLKIGGDTRTYIGTEFFVSSQTEPTNSLSGMILVLKSNGREFFISSFAPGYLEFD